MHSAFPADNREDLTKCTFQGRQGQRDSTSDNPEKAGLSEVLSRLKVLSVLEGPYVHTDKVGVVCQSYRITVQIPRQRSALGICLKEQQRLLLLTTFCLPQCSEGRLNNMDLKEFVSETLKQIFDGVTTAQESVKSLGGKINPDVFCTNVDRVTTPMLKVREGGGRPVSQIVFDVALTITDTSGKAGKAGLVVWGVGAGVEGSSQTTNSTVSRVKFSVNVELPPAK